MSARMPFPGMDPYLERTTVWPGFHTRLIVAIANQLGPRLRPRYVASVEERVYVEVPERQVVPDVSIRRLPGPSGSVAAANAPAVAAPVLIEVEEVEVHERHVGIRDREQDLKVVCIIELLSPSNKDQGPGRDSYLRKQQETLASECHLVEIDLLRRGRHTVSVPASRLADAGGHDYRVCVSRWPRRRRFELYPCRLRERLPCVPVPLQEPDPDAPLDLQAALESVYEDGGYMLVLHYERPCEPALGSEDQAWAHERWQAYREARTDLFPPGSPQPSAK